MALGRNEQLHRDGDSLSWQATNEDGTAGRITVSYEGTPADFANLRKAFLNGDLEIVPAKK